MNYRLMDRLLRSLTLSLCPFPQLTLQLSLAGFAEFVLHLTRLNPDMMYIHQDSGLMNVSYYRFDIDDSTGMLFDCSLTQS